MFRTTIHTLLCLSVLTLVGADAHAKTRSMAIMPLKAKGTVSQEHADILTDLLPSAVSHYGDFSTISPNDIQAMLDHDEIKEAFDCDEALCSAELGGALGVDELLVGTISGLGNTIFIQLNRIDTNHAVVLARSTARCENQPNLFVDAMMYAVRDAIGGEDALTSPKLSPAGSVSKVTAAPKQVNLWAWGSTTLGFAALGAGAYFGLQARSLADEAKAAETSGSQLRIRESQTMATRANVAFAVGGTLLTTAIALWVTDDDGEATMHANISPFRDGARVELQGVW